MLSDGQKHVLSVVPLAVGAAIVVSGLLWYADWHADQRAVGSELYSIQGRTLEVGLAPRELLFEDGEGRQIAVALLPDTQILDERGNAIVLSYIKTGDVVRVRGTLSGERSLVPTEIRIMER